MTQGNISLNELTEVGFEETASPQQGDLAIYVPCVHYGIYYRGNRIRSKLGIGGAVCEHPFSAFAGISIPKFYHRASE